MDYMERGARALSQEWWLFLLEGVVAIVFGIMALVWPSSTLGVLIGIAGWFALIVGVIGVFAAIGAAGVGKPWGWKLTSAILGIITGLVILRWPGLTALFVLALVGVWAISTGIINIVSSFADRDTVPHAWLLALGGVVSVLFGIAMFAWPSVGLLTLVYLIGIYAILFGVINCVTAFQVRRLPEQVAAAQVRMPSRGADAAI